MHSLLSSSPLFPTSMPHRRLSLKISPFPMPSPAEEFKQANPSYSRVGSFSLLPVWQRFAVCLLTRNLLYPELAYCLFLSALHLLQKSLPRVHTSGTQQLPQKLDFRDSRSRDCQKTCSWGMRRTHNTRALLCPCSVN